VSAAADRPADTGGSVVDPVARVMIDLPLPHLDRPFDYLISAELDDAVTPGVRVRVRFAGRLVDGYVLERVAASEHPTRLSRIERVVGTVPVLTPETAAFFRSVADRYGGSFVDVARLGIPARHARAETAATSDSPIAAAAVTAPNTDGWSRYGAGEYFLAAVTAARPARAVWSALPGEDWPLRIAEVMQAALAGGRGAIAVVPDARDLARLDLALTAVLGKGRHVALSADLGPSQRYRRWLAVGRGEVQAVVATRAGAYAPVTDLGVVIVWDDGDDLHREPRAPYPDTRDILALRASHTGAAMLIGAYSRTVQAQQLLESGWAHEILPSRATLRSHAPRVQATGDDFELGRDQAARAARLPSIAWRAAHDALAAGTPVLVQVARAGYIPTLACARDRTPARCSNCGGPLAAAAGGVVACRWCGRPAADWRCPQCDGYRLRAVTIGAGRTAEELGRAFPGVLIRSSGGDSVLSEVDGRPALVVSTPGAEPVAEGGYGAALLLDGWSMLTRQELHAAEEALRRWANAAALVRAGGSVIVAADAGIPVVQALIRWDPGGFAARELAERAEVGLPPAVRMASLTGSPDAVADLLAHARLPDKHEVMGPVPVADDSVRMIVRVPREAGGLLAAALHIASGVRSARKAAEPVKVVLDPVELF
jgi:primosomal protein N' (replication factor Y)